jgi:Flp pilus assembly protein protease CpaA
MILIIYSIVCGLLLVVIAVIDIKKHIIPNLLVLFGFGWVLGWKVGDMDALIRAAIAMAFMFAVYLFFYWISKGKIGAGDVKLAALVGFMVGYPNILISMFIVGLLNVALAIHYSKKGKTLDKEIAYAPVLAIGCVVALACGNQIVKYFSGVLA